MKLKLILTASMLVALASIAIGGIQEKEQTGSAHMNMGMMDNCPMKVKGVQIGLENTLDGIAVTLTTDSGDVADLRRRAEAMAKKHAGSSSEGMHANMMPFSATSEDISKGARLILKPNDPAKLEEFRSAVQQHVEHMKQGGCSMMHGADMHSTKQHYGHQHGEENK